MVTKGDRESYRLFLCKILRLNAYPHISRVQERHIKTIRQQSFLGSIKIREETRKLKHQICRHGKNMIKENTYDERIRKSNDRGCRVFL